MLSICLVYNPSIHRLLCGTGALQRLNCPKTAFVAGYHRFHAFADLLIHPLMDTYLHFPIHPPRKNLRQIIDNIAKIRSRVNNNFSGVGCAYCKGMRARCVSCSNAQGRIFDD